MSDEARFERLRARLGELHGRSHALARQLGDVDLGELRGPGRPGADPGLAQIRGGRAAGR